MSDNYLMWKKSRKVSEKEPEQATDYLRQADPPPQRSILGQDTTGDTKPAVDDTIVEDSVTDHDPKTRILED